jgi:flagellar biosynthesis/type III secretory pathway protein FliH
MDAERETMRSYLASIEAGFANSAEFFAPLKKLALHIAQQLVRGELQSSGAAVSRLIDRCLEGAGGRKPLAIRLHPHDIAMFRKMRGDDCAGLPLVEDASFVPGSVRVEFDDGWIDDMMQDRVDEIALALQAGAAIDPQPAPENS